MMKNIVVILLFVLGCLNSLLGNNKAVETVTITDLSVNTEAQGDQGVAQLIVRGTVDYSGDVANLTYSYSIINGTAKLVAIDNYAILSDVSTETATIQLIVSDNEGTSDTSTIVYTAPVTNGGQLYQDKTTWDNSVTYYDPKEPAFNYYQRTEGLPKVLLIGNSISIGYTPKVQNGLKGICNVNRVPTNAGSTFAGLANLDFWLNAEEWDLIHFNFGLHDLKYLLNNQLNLDGTQVASPQKYGENLELIITRIKEQTSAKLVFANTTVVKNGAAGRIPADVPVYNEVAEEIMNRLNIPIDDHYTLTLNNPSDFTKDGVHFNDKGKTRQANQVVSMIKQELNLGGGDDNNGENPNNYSIWKSGSSKWNVKVANKATNGFNRSSLGVWAFQDIAVEPGKEYEVTFDYEIANSSGSKGAGIKVGIHEGAVSATNFSSLGLKTYTTNATTPNAEASNGAIKFTPTQQSVKIVVFKIGEGSKKASASVSNLDIKQTTLSASLYERLGVKIEIEDNKIIANGGTVEAIYNALGQEVKNHDLGRGIYFVRVTNGVQSVVVKLVK